MSAPDELVLWKQKRLLEMQRKMLERELESQKEPEKEKKTVTSEEKVSGLFAGRANEVYEAARRQFPEATKKVIEVLAKLIDRGELSGPVSGEELYAFFRMLGIRVRLQTKITYLEHGKIKSIADRIRQA